ncbi:hypothetical protein AKJ56_01660 [candidate division MSBL1 archaeon SCGC-AAA382N08]|uniref:tRNA threonylcarbamoyladenosine biosynthesis protein TsaE n=1 Tax=candidate division MSBL1 archaeon SCGC-AAA382N08 TaxID=1698285 RepID=A0A133VP35_9EURY|nr:hypothetical protein AKJ56_01660 [candidate division MSBL1 archaeon SCGC-AAA382N08]
MQKVLPSEKQTKKFAESLVKEIKQSSLKESASVIALEGDLGSGKTKLTQFLAEALGIKQRITSPTFLIMREYEIPQGSFKHFFHIDAYRIEEKDLLELGFKEITTNPENLIAIEWADRVKDIIPQNTWWLTLSHGKEKEERIISIKND